MAHEFVVPVFSHIPVMPAEVVGGLRPRAGGRYVDGTLGGGGHAEMILDESHPDGWLYGCDRDAAAVTAAHRRLERFKGRFELRCGRYEDLAGWIEPGTCDGVLVDLGVSSHQLDTAERGFSFQWEGPLDMRMDCTGGPTAAEMIDAASEEELARVFFVFGEEPRARRVAAAIVDERRRGPIRTTRDLAALVERCVPRGKGRVHPATKVFQAMRIWVNDELGALERGLPVLWSLLRPGGRLVTITFHSLEARLVKSFGRSRERAYRQSGPVDIPELRIPATPELRWVCRRAACPSEAEVQENPRSRSAQLRVMEKL